MEKITFELEEGTADFFVLEQADLAGEHYILVAESEDEESSCLILKEMISEDAEQCIYETVEDEELLEALSKIFEELLEDTSISVSE